MHKPHTIVAALIPLFVLVSTSHPIHAQDSNFLLPIPELERRLQFEELDVFRMTNARFKNDPVKRVIMKWSDGRLTQVSWKRAPEGGEAVNNAPRYEIAAYQLQKFFLTIDEYVVPPTVARSLPISVYREIDKETIQLSPTFDHTQSVLFVLQYWLENVSSKDYYDKKRSESDTTYARHLGNMNILTYLVRHNDSNVGNFLISTDPANPRLFSHDNGLAFESRVSDRGYEWREIRVKRLPRSTVERVREMQSAELHKKLGVLAQFAIENEQLRWVEPGVNLDPKEGVRVTEEVVQLGLTRKEIDGLVERQQKLLERIDKGKIAIF
jgi:hypothetical protein